MNEHRPMPRLPISSWPPGLDVAPKIGGCGCCSGFGCTRRGAPILQCLPSAWYSSIVHAFTMCSSASPHSSRVSLGSMPKPSNSARVDERPVPKSTRPSEMRSSTATDSAVRIGWLYGFGNSRTPYPMRMFSVQRRDRAVEHLGVRAVRVLVEEVVLDGPERVEPIRSPSTACSIVFL